MNVAESDTFFVQALRYCQPGAPTSLVVDYGTCSAAAGLLASELESHTARELVRGSFVNSPALR